MILINPARTYFYAILQISITPNFAIFWEYGETIKTISVTNLDKKMITHAKYNEGIVILNLYQ